MTEIQRVKRILPYSTMIDSMRAMKTFMKNRPKVPQLLEIDYFHPTIGSSSQTKMIKQRIIKISKNSKIVKGLRLHKCLFYSQAKKDHQLKYIMKKFSNIESISLSLNGPWDDLLFTYEKWLMYPKRLNKLYFVFRKFVQSPLAAKIEGYIEKFLKTIQRKKLKVMKIFLQAQCEASLEKFMFFKNYPKTVEKLSFSWKGWSSPVSLSGDYDQNKKALSLQNLSKLQTFNLIAPLSEDKVLQVLNTDNTSSSDYLKTIEICLNSEQNHFFLLQNSLKHFPNLTTISLKTDHVPSEWGLPVSLFASMPLKNLKLETSIEGIDDLKYLGLMIQNSPGLKGLILKIRNKKAIDFTLNNCFEDFFMNISQLTQLEKMKIYFTLLFHEKIKQKKTNRFISHLSSCVRKLENLKELSFRFGEANFIEEISELTESLKPKSLQMKKLKINFSSEKMQSQKVLDFFALLTKMKNLESLALDSLYFTKTATFEAFTSSIIQIPRLRNLKMNTISGSYNLILLKDMIVEISQKRGLKKLYCTKSPQSLASTTANLVESNKICLKTIVSRNPQLEAFYVPFDIFQNGIDDLFLCKWKFDN